MDVLLIYAKHRMTWEIGRDREVPSFSRDDVNPPLGLLYLGGALRAAGIGVEVVDDSFSTDGEIREKIRSSRYVGISSLTPNVPRALELMGMVREAGRTAILGGAHATSMPGYFLERGADFVVVGEGERTLPELLEALDGGKDPSRIRGIGYRENGALRFTEPRPPERDLDALDGIAWDLIDYEQYFKALEYRVFTTMATRGCPFACTFCNKRMSTRLYRKRDPVRVVDEVEEQIKRLRCERVFFSDDNFTCDKKWVRAFCGEVMRRKLRFQWETTTRADHRDLDLLMTMRAAGCIKLDVGVESGSDRILKSLNKRITSEQVIETSRYLRLAGIWYKFFLIFGIPWETREDLELTRRTVFAACPDKVGVTLLIPMPGSALWDQMQDRLLPEALDFEGLHYYHRKEPTYRHDHLTQEELIAFRDRLQRDHERYYRSMRFKLRRVGEKAAYALTHPGYLWKRFKTREVGLKPGRPA